MEWVWQQQQFLSPTIVKDVLIEKTLKDLTPLSPDSMILMAIRGQILKKKTPLTVDEAFSMALQEEQQREITLEADNTALSVYKYTPKPQAKGDISYDNSKPFCTRCKKNTQSINSCFY